MRYCNATCQHDHWRRGHKQMCKKIHRGGNAEQYHADKKYKEAVAVAVEACADDTKGQTCYICTQALHWKTKEGLVRMCACRGTAGFAHVSCLAEQAKISYAEAEENNLDVRAAANLADALMRLGHHDEALPVLLETIPKSQRVLGKDHDQTFKLQRMYAQILCEKEGASPDDLTLAVATLEDVDRRQRRTLGPDHPQRKMTQLCLEFARGKQAFASLSS